MDGMTWLTWILFVNMCVLPCLDEIFPNNNIHLKVYSMEGKKLFEAKEKSDMFMRQVFLPISIIICIKWKE